MASSRILTDKPNVVVKYLMVESSAPNQQYIAINTDYNFTCEAIYLKHYMFSGITADGTTPTMPYTTHFNVQTDGGKFTFDSFMRSDGGHGVPLQLNPGVNTFQPVDPPLLMVQQPAGNVGTMRINITDDQGNAPVYQKAVIVLALYDCKPLGTIA